MAEFYYFLSSWVWVVLLLYLSMVTLQLFAGSGRAGGVSDRSAEAELRDAPEVPLLPLDKVKGKVNFTKYPRESKYLRSAVRHALTVGPRKVGSLYGATFARRYQPPFGVRVWSPDILTLYVVSVPKMVSSKWPSITVFASLCIPS